MIIYQIVIVSCIVSYRFMVKNMRPSHRLTPFREKGRDETILTRDSARRDAYIFGGSMPFDPNKTGVFEPYKASKAPEIALGLIVMVLLVATLVWLLSVA